MYFVLLSRLTAGWKLFFIWLQSILVLVSTFPMCSSINTTRFGFFVFLWKSGLIITTSSNNTIRKLCAILVKLRRLGSEENRVLNARMRQEANNANFYMLRGEAYKRANGKKYARVNNSYKCASKEFEPESKLEMVPSGVWILEKWSNANVKLYSSDSTSTRTINCVLRLVMHWKMFCRLGSYTRHAKTQVLYAWVEFVENLR